MKTTFPLVSVIIPVYNHEKYVEQALNSVWNQSYPTIELIVIDDGSSDKSSVVIHHFLKQKHETAKRTVIFIQQENQGAHAAINRGLEHSKGQFLTILNSDDYYDLTRIEKLVQALDYQKGDWAFTGVHGIDEIGQALPLNHFWKLWYEKNVWNSCLQPTMGFQLLQDNLAVSTGNLFFSRSLYEKVGTFKNYRLAHDLDYILRALIYSEPIFIQEKLYNYRMHQTNTLHQVNHLVEKEKASIYKNYLSEIHAKPPENLLAPCHWYWPVAFPKLRQDFGMDKGFLNELLETQKVKDRASHPMNVHKSSVKKTKKITLITHTLCLSGAPKVVLELAKVLQQQGYIVNVLSIWEGPLRKDFEAIGISVYSTEKIIYWYTSKSKIKKIYKLLKLLFFTYFKTHNTVICNCAVSWRLLFPLVLSSPFKNFFWYIHDSFSPSFMIDSGTALNIFQRIKNRSNLKLWFGSDSTRQIWKEGVEGKVKYWSGIPQQIPNNQEKKEIKNILSVGSVSPRKAPHLLVDAFIICIEQKRIPEYVTLTIIGFDTTVGDVYLYELLNKKQEARDRIRFIKHVEADDLKSFYQNADLYIQSSVVECLPLALLQAMATGLPIITTDANGCVEAIEHNVTGYICPSRNLLLLADAISEAVSKPIPFFKMGKNAQKKFNEMFSLEKNQEEILKELS